MEDPEDGTLRAMQDAASLAVYRKERASLARAPDRAAYWLLSHAVLGAVKELAQTLELTRSIRHPVVEELHRTLGVASEAPTVLEALIAQHRPDLPRGFLGKVQAAARAR